MSMLAATGSVECSGRDTRVTEPAVATSRSTSPAPELVDGPPRASASAFPEPVRETTPEAMDPENLPEPPGSTRGTIACGAERCTAGKQVCTSASARWHCVDGKAESGMGGLYCDDGTDCGPGLTCCMTGASAELVQECTTRHGPESNCAREVCKPGGARCPRGQRCEGSFCSSDLAVTCPGSGKVRCGNDEYCEWKSDATACVKEPVPVEDTEEPRGVFACTKPLDCGKGNQCCTSMSVFWHSTGCATNCDVTNSRLVCESASDCKPMLALVPSDMRQKAKLTCKPIDGEGPPWLKVCDLDLP
jgi:hypothetical protein